MLCLVLVDHFLDSGAKPLDFCGRELTLFEIQEQEKILIRVDIKRIRQLMLLTQMAIPPLVAPVCLHGCSCRMGREEGS